MSHDLRKEASPSPVTDEAPYHHFWSHRDIRILFNGLLGVLGVGILVAMSLQHYTLFHSIAEIFNIIIVFSIFSVLWNIRRYIVNQTLTLFGIGFLFTGFIELLHLLTFPNMAILPVANPGNVTVQLWLVARVMASVSLLVFMLYLEKPVVIARVWWGYSLVLMASAICLFVIPIFPVVFIEGAGLTPFNIVTEYVICMLFLLGYLVLARRRHIFTPQVYRLFGIAIALSCCSEFIFTLSTQLYGFPHFLGHLTVDVSNFLFYLVVMRMGLMDPYVALLYHDIFAHSRAVKLLIDPDSGAIIDANTSACQYYGYTYDQLTALTIWDLNMLGEAKSRARMAEAVLKTQSDFEFPHRLASGEIRDVEVFSGPVVSGGRILLHSIILDVTARKRAADALAISEARYRQIVETTLEGIWVLGRDKCTTYVNPQMAAMLGYTIEEMLGRNLTDFMDAEGRAITDAYLQGRGDGIAEQHDFRFQHKDGHDVWTLVSTNSLINADGHFDGVLSMITNITARKHAEDALRESETRFRMLFETMAQGVVYHNAAGSIVAGNPAAAAILGHSIVQLLGCSAKEAYPDAVQEDDIPLPDNEYPALLALASGQPVRDLIIGIRPLTMPTRRWLLVDAVPEFIPGQTKPYRVCTTFTDITVLRTIEDTLRASLAEKTVLLKEVHHRVKNNLQIISSLLNLQASKIQAPDGRDVLRSTQTRVHSMALLHDTLYRESNLAQIEMPAYIAKLCAYLSHSSAKGPSHITLTHDIDAIALSLDQAVPCALIVTELISNAYKHAFPDARDDGNITMRLRADNDGMINLQVQDNGIGLPPSFSQSETDSLGMKLVHLLINQLHGNITMTSEYGTNMMLRFPTES